MRCNSTGDDSSALYWCNDILISGDFGTRVQDVIAVLELSVIMNPKVSQHGGAMTVQSHSFYTTLSDQWGYLNGKLTFVHLENNWPCVGGV